MLDNPIEVQLPVKLEGHELTAKGKQLGEAVQKLHDLEEEKKSKTKELANGVIAQQTLVDELAQVTTTGIEYRPVVCQWRYNFPGEGQKTLIRLDRDEVVESEDMYDEDYDRLAELAQLKLDLNFED